MKIFQQNNASTYLWAGFSILFAHSLLYQAISFSEWISVLLMDIGIVLSVIGMLLYSRRVRLRKRGVSNLLIVLSIIFLLSAITGTTFLFLGF